MDITPHRPKAKRPPLLDRPEQTADDADWSGIAMPGQRQVVRRMLAVYRAGLVLFWTAISLVVQSLLVLLPGTTKIRFARFYWSVMCRLLGLHVRVIGTPATAESGGRPVIFVSNHSSWLDIPVLGGTMTASFIAKEEVGRWPVVRTIARLGRTVYVRRTRASTVRERDDMGARLASGDSLVLFPEGTTSDGSRVMPFRSSFLSIAELAVMPDGRGPIVQPVSVVYDRLAGLPMGRAARPLFAWYGDMDIGSHFWRLAQHSGLGATVLLHTPIDPARFKGRKELAQASWDIVAGGAALLRQNRKATPY